MSYIWELLTQVCVFKFCLGQKLTGEVSTIEEVEMSEGEDDDEQAGDSTGRSKTDFAGGDSSGKTGTIGNPESVAGPGGYVSASSGSPHSDGGHER